MTSPCHPNAYLSLTCEQAMPPHQAMENAYARRSPAAQDNQITRIAGIARRPQCHATRTVHHALAAHISSWMDPRAT